jgi:hypothetical protein
MERDDLQRQEISETPEKYQNTIMLSPPSSSSNTLPRCQGSSGKGLSWLTSMSRFLNFLQSNRDFSLRHVRIVRYEDLLDRGTFVCQGILEFVGKDLSTRDWSSPLWDSSIVKQVDLCVAWCPVLPPLISDSDLLNSLPETSPSSSLWCHLFLVSSLLFGFFKLPRSQSFLPSLPR